MPTTQDYSGIVSRLKFLTLPTATPDTANDYLVFLDATTGDLARALWPSGGGGGGISDGDKGDITVSSGGTVWNIDAGAVTTTELGGDITTAGKALLDDADASAQRTTLGLGNSATRAVGTTAGTVCAGDDSRLSDPRAAAAIIETAGPTTMPIGAIADGQVMRRSGGDVVGQTIAAIATTGSASDLSTGTVPTARLGSGTASSTTYLRGDQSWASVTGGDVLFSDCPNTTTNVASVTAVEVMNKSVTLAVGDVLNVELWGVMRNDSGAGRTYTPSMLLTVGVNTLTLTCLDGLALTNVAGASRCYWRVRGMFTVASTSATQGLVESDRATAAVAANTAGSIAATTNRKVWNTTSSNMVGSGSIAVRFASNAATATQEFTTYGYTIRKIAKAV